LGFVGDAVGKVVDVVTKPIKKVTDTVTGKDQTDKAADAAQDSAQAAIDSQQSMFNRAMDETARFRTMGDRNMEQYGLVSSGQAPILGWWNTPGFGAPGVNMSVNPDPGRYMRPIENIDPYDVQSQGIVNQLMSKQDNQSQGILNQVRGMNPSDPQTQQILNNVKAMNPAEDPRTYQVLDRIRGMDANDPRSLQILSQVQNMDYRDPKSQAMIDRVANINYQDPRSNQILEQIRGLDYRDPRSLELLNKIIAQNPNDPQSQAMLDQLKQLPTKLDYNPEADPLIQWQLQQGGEVLDKKLAGKGQLYSRLAAAEDRDRINQVLAEGAERAYGRSVDEWNRGFQKGAYTLEQQQNLVNSQLRLTSDQNKTTFHGSMDIAHHF